jgi:hypothetical protein
MTVIRIEDLPFSAIAHELVGADHGVGITCLIVDAPPGRGHVSPSFRTEWL